ncbi:UNVERIFIED_CONTAM: BRI1 kinase inhibitor 1 [Sesamum calycinum]|uniref:BRI1 kinase inhibitor 1 n=1 Tax=Sesamum calycinum TaxID=2727403 RepID=A0AAW2QM27_9LAMI
MEERILRPKREGEEEVQVRYKQCDKEVRSKKELRGRKGEFSAPASMRTSPTNSGHLVASGSVTPTKSDSTMEELQAAIQAAIAHCKKSIATDDKIKPSL